MKGGADEADGAGARERAPVNQMKSGKAGVNIYQCNKASRVGL